jgi:hypothetical protein
MNNTVRIARAAVLAALFSTALTNQTLRAAISGVNLSNTVTATMDAGERKLDYTWYELGVNSAASTTGIKTGLLTGQTDPLSTYLLQSASGLNTLMLDTNRRSGTITFERPVNVTALSLAGSSGHGAGTVTATLRFTDGSTNQLSPLTFADWFPPAGVSNFVETANGRISISGNSFDAVSSGNPKILAVNTTLTGDNAAKDIFAIDLSWTGQNANTVTAIFGVSGDVTGIGHFTAIPLANGTFNQDMIVGLAEIPEPGTMVLLGLGAAGLLAYARRKNA